MIDDEQGGFKEGRGCLDQIFILKQIGFMDFKDACDMIIRDALWQVLRMYDVGGKLLNGIKSMYANSLACVKVKVCKSECFRIDSGA